MLMMLMASPPATAQAVVNGPNVSSVAFGQGGAQLGEYRQTAPGQWVETNEGGAVTFNFVETQRDEWSVYLLDQSRAVNIQIDLFRKKVVYSDSASSKFDLYDVLSAAAAPDTGAAPVASASPPAPPAPAPAEPPTREFPETYSAPLQLKERPANVADAGPGYYNIAHMTNVTGAVDWALEQGANALEMDINFTSDGTPEEFRHGGFCDCACGAGASGVCSQFSHPVCEANTDAATMLNHVAGKAGVALVVIDSKVGSLEESALQAGGRQIIELLDRELYGRGYRGDTIVGIGDREQFSYIAAAANAALGSANREHYYYSIDQGGDQTAATIQKLMTLPTNNLAYGTGLTACSPNKYHEAIKKGVANERAGVIGLTYIWTIDKESSMKAYLDDGARGIITNEPGTLATVLKNRGARLAEPGERIPVSLSQQYVASTGSSVGTRCDSNSDCDNTACARPHANNADKVCCASNDTRNYGGYDYCANMASGTACWSDAMCASGSCKGNAGGLQRGTCN
jgi:hypothetical protein